MVFEDSLVRILLCCGTGLVITTQYQPLGDFPLALHSATERHGEHAKRSAHERCRTSSCGARGRQGGSDSAARGGHCVCEERPAKTPSHRVSTLGRPVAGDGLGQFPAKDPESSSGDTEPWSERHDSRKRDHSADEFPDERPPRLHRDPDPNSEHPPDGACDHGHREREDRHGRAGELA